MNLIIRLDYLHTISFIGDERVIVRKEKGVIIEDDHRRVIIDPRYKTEHAIVSHAHMDHLRTHAMMSIETYEIMQVRLGTDLGIPVQYGKCIEYNGLEVSLYISGHVMGSAMIKVDGDTEVLYTGDINPRGSLLIDKPKPISCSILVIESTYGSVLLPDLSLIHI